MGSTKSLPPSEGTKTPHMYSPITEDKFSGGWDACEWYKGFKMAYGKAAYWGDWSVTYVWDEKNNDVRIFTSDRNLTRLRAFVRRLIRKHIKDREELMELRVHRAMKIVNYLEEQDGEHSMRQPIFARISGMRARELTPEDNIFLDGFLEDYEDEERSAERATQSKGVRRMEAQKGRVHSQSSAVV